MVFAVPIRLDAQGLAIILLGFWIVTGLMLNITQVPKVGRNQRMVVPVQTPMERERLLHPCFGIRIKAEVEVGVGQSDQGGGEIGLVGVRGNLNLPCVFQDLDSFLIASLLI
jgi:hypothetical protein